jgi:Class III cytochrome C family
MKKPGAWTWVLAGLVLAGLLLLVAESYRSHYSVEQPALPVVFEHQDHIDTACAECHHNFVDDTGGGVCYHCHKFSPDIASENEKMFHDFCFGCHVDKRWEGEESGPMRECAGCHTP